MLKKLILISIALAGFQLSVVDAQSISRKVVSSTGGTLTGGSNQITFTIGETVIPTLSAGSNVITQGFQQPGEQIVTGTVASICQGSSVSVPYTAIDIGGGNIFTAQLSDAAGSFASPVAIGTLAGNASGSINATIPIGTVAGNGYKIRVVATVPQTIGSESPAFSIYENPAVVITAPTAMLCNGATGTATANVTGGTAAYTYAWSNSATGNSVAGLGAGTYSVVVTDANGCVGTSTDFVLQENILNAINVVSSDYNGSNISCAGAADGEITINPTSFVITPPVPSAGPFEYSMSGGPAQSSNVFAGLSAGYYGFTVTDLSTGCVFTDTTVTLVDPTPVGATATVNNNGCFGGNNGSATANGSGGTGVYTYNWLTPVPKQTQTNNEIPAGTWTVVVTDANGCTATATVTIVEPPQLTVTLGPDKVVLYGGLGQNGCTNLVSTVGGGTAPYTYVWSATHPNPAIPGMTTGTINVCNMTDTTYSYTVIVTDANGCTASATVLVLYANIDCSSNNNNTKIKICRVPPGNPANCQTICISINAVPALLANGSYLGPCLPNCALPARPAQGAITQTFNSELNVYPNPVSGVLHVAFRSEWSEAESIVITDLQGRVVNAISLEGTFAFEREIDMSNLIEGIYFINVMDKGSLIKSAKVIKLK